MKLKWQDPTYRQMISNSVKGFKHTVEDRKKMNKWCVGKKLSDEHKQKLRDAMYRYYSTRQWTKRKEWYCKQCGKLIRTAICDIGVFCSKICYNRWMQDAPPQLSPAYIDGRSFEPYPIAFKTIREKIRNRDGYKCQYCGAPQIECIQALCVHHKDHNKDNLQWDNLISLCHNCHSKLHQKERSGVRR